MQGDVEYEVAQAALGFFAHLHNERFGGYPDTSSRTPRVGSQSRGW
ncbi:hypothetical protein GCM10010169_34420 [Micromonospora fulviviridis]|nr:hypothetical protein [Micromonospora fulviviridis]GGR87305.1 hypothetical protein GCM10010169_34420 [Micromonospora fulviviridis]